MDDEQLIRYSRHILLPQIDYTGQQRLSAGHVMIVGLGGLGSPVAMYLAASGVGHLTLIDDDHVELSNLQRQIIHTEPQLGKAKVASAKAAIAALNHHIQVTTHTQRFDRDNMLALVKSVDIVVDCSDNFATRFGLNAVTQQTKTPLVSGAAIKMEGQVAVYDPRINGSPCYQCVYHDEGELVQQSCADRGVLSPLLGMIGSIQAVETVKLLAKFGDSLAGRLMLIDAATMQCREMRLTTNPDCPVCQSVTKVT